MPIVCISLRKSKLLLYFFKYMDRVEELNDRLRNRNIADTPTFYFSPRPVPTKYTTMPILDEKLPATVPLRNEHVFDVTNQFLPGTSAPWSGRIEKIDNETQLIINDIVSCDIYLLISEPLNCVS